MQKRPFVPNGKSPMEFAVESLTLFETGTIRRWQVISRLVHLGISTLMAEQTADAGSFPVAVRRHLLSMR